MEMYENGRQNAKHSALRGPALRMEAATAEASQAKVPTSAVDDDDDDDHSLSQSEMEKCQFFWHKFMQNANEDNYLVDDVTTVRHPFDQIFDEFGCFDNNAFGDLSEAGQSSNQHAQNAQKKLKIQSESDQKKYQLASKFVELKKKYVTENQKCFLSDIDEKIASELNVNIKTIRSWIHKFELTTEWKQFKGQTRAELFEKYHQIKGSTLKSDKEILKQLGLSKNARYRWREAALKTTQNTPNSGIGKPTENEQSARVKTKSLSSLYETN
uniref:Homeobox domain-containing protein n=1 Tax=Globodera rostochiensis TaxID=31243 RepID=A0A914HQM8_GLORO